MVNIKGYEKDKLVACTLLFEGSKNEMEAKHREIMKIARKFKGMSGGAENGLRGYLLTFVIAYTRDLACDYNIAAESFETSCSWSNVSSLTKKVTKRIKDEAAKCGFTNERIWISFRVT